MIKFIVIIEMICAVITVIFGLVTILWIGNIEAIMIGSLLIMVGSMAFHFGYLILSNYKKD